MDILKRPERSTKTYKIHPQQWDILEFDEWL